MSSLTDLSGVRVRFESAATGTVFTATLAHVDLESASLLLWKVRGQGQCSGDKLVLVSKGQLSWIEPVKVKGQVHHVNKEKTGEDEDNYSLFGSPCPSTSSSDSNDSDWEDISDTHEEEPDQTSKSMSTVSKPDGTSKDEQEDSGLSSQIEDSSSRDATPPPPTIDDDLVEIIQDDFKNVHLDDIDRRDEKLYSKVVASTPKEKEGPPAPSDPYSVPMAKTPQQRRQHPRQFPDYVVPEELVPILESGLKKFKGMTEEQSWVLDGVLDLLRNNRMNTVGKARYKEILTFLLYAEEYQAEKDLEQFDMYSAKLKRVDEGGAALEVAGLIDKSPNVLKGDLICLCVAKEWYDLTVEETYKNQVFFKSTKEMESQIFRGGKEEFRYCDVQFTVNQSTFRCMHRALSLLANHQIRALFPPEPDPEGGDPPPTEPEDKLQELELFNKSIADNEEQMQAIRHIVSGSSHPHPYIIFGPPGTGKTVTVVEAIKQVYKTIKDSRIVVAAPSNTAADLLACRLVGDIKEKDMVRLVAPSREGMEVDPLLDDLVVYGKIKLKRLLQFRVVVVTLTTSGRLISAGISRGHFTHAFVDEAGQATEPESIVPVAGILDCLSLLVLSGDPNQLGPVNMSPVAKSNGLDISLMERLMTTCGAYMRNPKTGKWNPRMMTKLLKNFRSHPRLLELPSNLFYDGELIVCKEEEKDSDSIVKSLNCCAGFPLIFHGVMSKVGHTRSKNTTSLMNVAESKAALTYARRLKTAGLTPSQVGLISPYRRQVRQLKEELADKLGWDESKVLVGSTEEFQGQERDVMILSTVRSWSNNCGPGTGGLGFLTNKKRFNVAITRAKRAMIVIGDPRLLQRDPNWRALIEYAIDNGGYRGAKFKLKK